MWRVNARPSVRRSVAYFVEFFSCHRTTVTQFNVALTFLEKNMATVWTPAEGQGSSSLEQLLSRTLVIVAHPDDESVSCGALLQRIASSLVVFCTDATPESPYFWKPYYSREAYQNLRRTEAFKALKIAGVSKVEFLDGNRSDSAFRDQSLYRVLPQAMKALDQAFLRFRPEAILAPAYEGGHPDHDSCSFLANALGRKCGIQVWEMPLYHRCAKGSLVCQYFLDLRGSEVELHPEGDELHLKKQMIDTYQSQPSVWNFVRPGMVETFRPQPEYDYSQPPHLGLLNYEAWQWSMTGNDLCSAFDAFEERVPDMEALLAGAASRTR
jgi:N-acetylglucosamine malate deacetylase 2